MWRPSGLHVIEEIADPLDDGEVRSLVAAPDIIGLPDAALHGDEVEGCHVIIHIKPVPDVLAIARR